MMRSQEDNVDKVFRPSLVRDIRERKCDDVEPVAPELGISGSGFPTHTKKRLSKFKLRDVKDSGANAVTPRKQGEDSSPLAFASGEKDAIDRENKQRLASMSETEIFREQQELKSHLGSRLIETLMKRGNRDDFQRAPPPMPPQLPIIAATPASSTSKGAKEATATANLSTTTPYIPETQVPKDLVEESEINAKAASVKAPVIGTVHFPKPMQPPDLDLNDPEFNRKLHSTYFPALSADPSGLSWMQPISDEERSEYSPALESLSVSSIRFDFRGQLLSPRQAARIPVSKGLHHHGDAPESAGYTIPELAHLAQSAIPSQRCIAYQTLGRLLYRLGRGEYGHEGDDLYEGLWQAVEKTKVLDAMIQVAARENEGHRSAWVYATDAIHLWRKGGGKRWQGR